MAGTSNPTKSAWPHGENSGVMVRLGGYIPNGRTNQVVDTWIAPFDCTVVSVNRSYAQTGSAHVQDITLKTIDSTAKTIVAELDASTDIAGVKQTLHDDIVGFTIVTGNGIQLIGDTQGGNEEGLICDTIIVRPVYG